eukprot:TRINITY_DN23429_c0_g1_i1.p1 TRINITY_DN23429_c0_g1~~TRINITY_DN23429_c0_g1_i1.p1  ORF type:complete len:357 (+),score=45.96 TRINITY_DN23429_c0_g1_i1:70-1071(+)
MAAAETQEATARPVVSFDLPETSRDETSGTPAARATASSDAARPRPSPSSRSIIGAYISGRSQWRFPSKPGEMPKYVQRAFRIKVFGLMALQLAMVFTIMVLMDQYSLLDELKLGRMHNLRSQMVFYLVGMFNVISALVLLCMKDRFPWNYLLLTTTTLLSGIFWGLAPTIVTTTLHFQLIGILCCTMIVAAAMSAILVSMTSRNLEAVTVVIVSLVIGWLVGVMVDVLVIANFLVVHPLAVLGVIGFSFLLLAVLHLEAGRALIQCRPDDFMSVIVAMNSTLMVVVSIPFFIISFCFLHTGEAVMEEQEDAQAAPEPVAVGRQDNAPVIVPV